MVMGKMVAAALEILNVNLCFINPIRAPSTRPNMCNICNWKLWLSVGGAFSQLLAQSGYKKTALGKEFNQPVLLKLLWQFQMLDWQEKNGQLTFKIATNPSVTSCTTRIERNRSKLGVEIHSSYRRRPCVECENT